MTVEVAAAAPHEPPWRDAVHGLKYRGQTRTAVDLAELLVPLLSPWRENSASVREKRELPHSLKVTWVPTTDHRRRTRGFDQAELLARHLAAHVGVPHARLLRRTSRAHQTGSSREVRLIGPSFVARPVGNMSVIVVDDVTTTGATFRAAARALVNAGADHILCLAVTAVAERSVT